MLSLSQENRHHRPNFYVTLQKKSYSDRSCTANMNKEINHFQQKIQQIIVIATNYQVQIHFIVEILVQITAETENTR